MAATLTHERRRYTCRLWTVDRLGYVRCGACWAASGGDLKDCRSFDVHVEGDPPRERPADWVDHEAPQTWTGSRFEPAPCETCRKLPAAFQEYEDTCRVQIEHVRCRIY